MYNSTPPGGSRQTPCTNPKLLAKGELDLVAVAAGGRNEAEGRSVGGTNPEEFKVMN